MKIFQLEKIFTKTHRVVPTARALRSWSVAVIVIEMKYYKYFEHFKYFEYYKWYKYLPDAVTRPGVETEQLGTDSVILETGAGTQEKC